MAMMLKMMVKGRSLEDNDDDDDDDDGDDVENDG